MKPQGMHQNSASLAFPDETGRRKAGEGEVRMDMGVTSSASASPAQDELSRGMNSSPGEGPYAGNFQAVKSESGLHFSGVGFVVPPSSWSGGGGDKQILTGVAGEVMRGESLALLGPSGAGKTTLLRILTNKTPGYGKPSGTVDLDDHPLTSTVLRKSCAFVEQEDSNLPALLTSREVSQPVASGHPGRVGP